MASRSYSFVLPAPLDAVWEFLDDLDNWAPLVPGYVDHEWLNDWELELKIRSEFPLFRKVFHLKIDLMEWYKPRKITFQVEGLNEKFTGKGKIETKPVDKTKTLIVGKIEIDAQSPLSKIFAARLKSSDGEKITEFADEIGEKIREYY